MDLVDNNKNKNKGVGIILKDVWDNIGVKVVVFFLKILSLEMCKCYINF